MARRLYPFLPVGLTWGSLPSGGVVSIWRVKGGAALGAGSIGHDAALGPLSVDLTSGVPGTVLMAGYAVDTAQPIGFTGDGTVLVEGKGNTSAAYFTARQSVQSGGTATLSLAPTAVPDSVCGMVAVAVG